MNCQAFHEQILDLILPGGEDRRRTELAAHAQRCPACAQYLAEMTRTWNALQPSVEIKATSNFKERVMNKIAEMEASGRETPRPRRRWLWRLGLAAAVLIAIGLAAWLGGNKTQSGGAAWALEKTIEAYRGVRFIHMKFEPAGFGHVSDMWAQFDEQGKLLSLRHDFPDTEDGPKVVVWQADKAEVWFKKKGSVAVVREPNVLKRLKMSINDFDPRLIVENLFQKEKHGQAQIKRDATVTSSGRLGLSVTYKDRPKDRPGLREVYHLDTASQLVTQMDKYLTKNGKEELQGRIYYLDYNKPEVAKVFKIEAPADVMRIDQTTQDVGLVKGSLSDNEMATKVAREFFEALIAGNYEQAGRIMEGIPGAALKKMLEAKGIKFLRIVTMDAPRPHPIPGTKGIQVPCKVEIEVNGVKSFEDFKLGVRPVYNHPDRWDVFGGF